MSILYPGALGRRPTRASSLLYAWRAADGFLVPYVGAGQATMFGTSGGSVRGLGGTTVTVGAGFPRFQHESDVLPLRLRMEAARSERATFPFTNQRVQTLTIYAKVRPNYTQGAGGAASPGNVLLTVGTNKTVAAGRMAIYRGTNGLWRAERTTSASSAAATSTGITEIGGWTYPYEVMAILNANSTVTLILRDATGATRVNVTSSAGSGLVNAVESWDGGLLHFGGADAADVLGDFDYEVVKVAPGIRTVTEMAAMG